MHNWFGGEVVGELHPVSHPRPVSRVKDEKANDRRDALDREGWTLVMLAVILLAQFECSGGMFRGSCFNCGSDKQGRRGHAITCRHVNFHGGSLIDAFAIMSHDAQCSFHNFEDTCLPNTVWQTANLKLAFGIFLFSNPLQL